MKTDTPRTDEQVNGKPCTRFSVLVGDSLRDAVVPSEFARELERENAKLRAELEKSKSLLALHFIKIIPTPCVVTPEIQVTLGTRKEDAK